MRMFLLTYMLMLLLFPAYIPGHPITSKNCHLFWMKNCCSHSCHQWRLTAQNSHSSWVVIQLACLAHFSNSLFCQLCHFFKIFNFPTHFPNSFFQIFFRTHFSKFFSELIFPNLKIQNLIHILKIQKFEPILKPKL